MSVLTTTATVRSSTGASQGFGDGVKHLTSTVELAAASSSSTINFGTIPANARILAGSKVYNDDLATSGSPTLDIGLFPVDGNITALDTALNDGIALSSASTANTGTQVVKDYANAGKKAWQFVTTQVTEPHGDLVVKGTVRDAATTATGTITLELLYALD